MLNTFGDKVLRLCNSLESFLSACMCCGSGMCAVAAWPVPFEQQTQLCPVGRSFKNPNVAAAAGVL